MEIGSCGKVEHVGARSLQPGMLPVRSGVQKDTSIVYNPHIPLASLVAQRDGIVTAYA